MAGSESGSGPAVISMAYPDNYDAPRDGVVMVRWPALTAGQTIRLAQAGCTYAVSTTSLSFSSPGGSGMFDVLQQSIPTECGGATEDRCVWTAQSTVPWIVITSSIPRSGDNPVAFSVSASGAAQPRSGQILVRDRVVTITPAAR